LISVLAHHNTQSSISAFEHISIELMIKEAVFIILCFASQVFAQSTLNSADSPYAFIPKGYVITETIRGDLNKDGLEDYVFITRGTLSTGIVKDEMRGLLDRNRRGIVVVFNQKTKYVLALGFQNCFSSENEDGGLYMPPYLNIYIQKGGLFVHYAHGRYGYWRYIFRYINSEFVLIGYDREEAHGPDILSAISINLLTKRMSIKENSNPNYTPIKLKQKWMKFSIKKPIRLVDFSDFDECKSTLFEC
jgi:hypothetical protein